VLAQHQRKCNKKYETNADENPDQRFWLRKAKINACAH